MNGARRASLLASRFLSEMARLRESTRIPACVRARVLRNSLACSFVKL
jgi:hypothetical protein